MQLTFARAGPRPCQVANTFVAGVADVLLGLKMKGLPPQRLWVERVDTGSWAERCGLQAGDELVAVQDRDVACMEAEELNNIVGKLRPLHLSFARNGASLLPSASFGTLKQLEPLLQLPGQCATPLLQRPLQELPSSEAHFFVVAGPVDAWHGLKTTALPPQRVFIERVDAGSWAARSGVMVGDELVAANGQVMEEMTFAQFFDLTTNIRPLQLTFASVGPRNLPGDVMTFGIPNQGSGNLSERFAGLKSAWVNLQRDFSSVGQLEHREVQEERGNGTMAGDVSASLNQNQRGIGHELHRKSMQRDDGALTGAPSPKVDDRYCSGGSRLVLQGVLQELDTLEGWLLERVEEEERQESLTKQVDGCEECSFRAGAFHTLARQFATAEPVLEDATGGTPSAIARPPSGLMLRKEMRLLHLELEAMQCRARREHCESTEPCSAGDLPTRPLRAAATSKLSPQLQPKSGPGLWLV